LDNLYPIASIAKPITAVAIMMLVEQGLLGLNRPVAEYIPEFRGTNKEMVLVHHLLNHTSGMDDLRLDQHIVEKAGTIDVLTKVPASAMVKTFLELGYDCPHVCPPGERHYYSMYCYELLGEIISRVSGQPFFEFIREHIFEPLGMQDAWFIPPEHLYDRLVHRLDTAPWSSPESPAYVGMSKTVQTVAHFERAYWRKSAWANASCFATAFDILRFGQMILNGGQLAGQRILSPASVAVMTRNQTRGIGSWFGEEMFAKESNYGYGWNVAGEDYLLRSPTLVSKKTFGHTGAGGTDLTIDAERELITVYFATELQKGAFDEHYWHNDLFVNMVAAAVLD
jgi:CubicO group peptidase (beta-lactamase class C family)